MAKFSAAELARRRNLGFKALAPAKEVPGWPKRLPCLGCSRPRLATDPADRLCPPCRARVAANDSGAPHRLLPW